jgi:hypothetical protein
VTGVLEASQLPSSQYAAEVLGQYNHSVLQCFLVAAFVYVIVNNILASVARPLVLRMPRTPDTA